MAKLTIDDLKRIKEETAKSTSVRHGEANIKITVHMGTCGIASDAREIMKAIHKEIDDQAVADVIFTTSGCAGLCSHEPMATVELRDEAPVKYVKLTEAKVKKILTEHVVGGKVVTEYALGKGHERVG